MCRNLKGLFRCAPGLLNDRYWALQTGIHSLAPGLGSDAASSSMHWSACPFRNVRVLGGEETGHCTELAGIPESTSLRSRHHLLPELLQTSTCTDRKVGVMTSEVFSNPKDSMIWYYILQSCSARCTEYTFRHVHLRWDDFCVHTCGCLDHSMYNLMCNLKYKSISLPLHHANTQLNSLSWLLAHKSGCFPSTADSFPGESERAQIPGSWTAQWVQNSGEEQSDNAVPENLLCFCLS